MAPINDMILFARVVEAGSFSAVASELDSSRSLVSKRIKGLETRLGTRLLNRTTRRLSLTESGEVYLEYCRAVRAAQEEAEQRLGEMAGTPQGRLRVSLPVSFGELHVAPLLAEFLARYPRVSLDLRMEDRFVDLVQAGFDLALRIGRLEDSTLVARRIGVARLAVYAAPAYLARRGRPARPVELRDHNCLIYQHEHGRYGSWEFREAGAPLRVDVTGNLRCDSGVPLREAARGGVGIARLPTFMVGDALARGELEELLPEYAVPDVGIHALFPHGPPYPLKTRVFVAFLEEALNCSRTDGAVSVGGGA